MDVILHPTGYTGTGGVLNLGVCIDPASLNAAQLEIPVRNNISVWNDLQPIASNVQTGVVSGIDAESVLLHEMGHCIGLAHVNAASESGLSGSDSDYTKATDGANNVFDINPGPDGVKGSHDDIRGDDVNLHWFNPANDPFQLPIHTPVDTTQYKRDTAFLPPGDSFAQNASRSVAPTMGYPSSEAVMQQGTYSGETQRELVSDDATTIMLAASGVDETAGTADDYQIVLNYEGITTGPNCDITVIMEQMTGLAYCSVSGYFISSNHLRISGASIHLGAGYTYHFNTQLRGGGGGNQPPVANNDATSLNEDGSVDIAVLANDTDADNDPLEVTGVGTPANGSATINPNDTIRYTPDANYNGADSFSYSIEDGNGGADSATVSVTVNPVNDFPVAVDDPGATTPLNTPVDIYVLGNDSDVDGDPLSVSAAGNGANGAVTNLGSYVRYQPNPGFTGADSFSYTAADGNGGTDNATVTVNVASGASLDYAVADFNAAQGTVSGTYLDTHAAGGAVQSITESRYGGSSNLHDSLGHVWQFNLTNGNNRFNVVAEGNFPAGDADSQFVFQWSTSPISGWQTMVTIPGGTTSFELGGSVSGTIYVRVIDLDSTPNNFVYSTISVDHMFFDGAAPPSGPPAKASAPSPANGAGDVSVNTELTWSAGAGTDVHDVYFGTNPAGLVLASSGQDGTSYNPGTLATDTTYYWRVDEQNTVGTTTGDVWSFTTSSAGGTSGIVVDSIKVGALKAGPTARKGGAKVTIVDQLGNAVSGATVTGTFTGSVNETVSVLSVGGVAKIKTTSTAAASGFSFTFCVDSISPVGGLVYNPPAPDCKTY